MWHLRFHVVDVPAKKKKNALKDIYYSHVISKGAVVHIWKYWFGKQRAIQIVIFQNILPKFKAEGYCPLRVSVKKQNKTKSPRFSLSDPKQFTEMCNSPNQRRRPRDLSSWFRRSEYTALSRGQGARPSILRVRAGKLSATHDMEGYIPVDEISTHL